MTIVERVKELSLPLDQVVVIGSGILDALGLRKSGDVDLVVSAELFARLRQTEGWTAEVKHNAVVLLKDDVEVWEDWGISEEASFSSLYQNSALVGGVHFANPAFVLAWKKQQGREKDARDIVLLEEYLARE